MKFIFPNKKREVEMAKRIERLASLITERCCEVKPGDKVYLITNHPSAQPLYQAVREMIIKKGAFVLDHFVYEDYLDVYFTSRSFLKNASDEQLSILPESKIEELKSSNAMVWIEAFPDPFQFSVGPERISKWAKTLGPMSGEYLQKKYVMTFFPTEDYAKWTKVPLKKLREIYYAACFVDREKLEEKMEKVKEIFDNASLVQIKGKGTDLSFSLQEMAGCLENGKENLPGGEVYYAPLKDSLEGFISFTYPGVHFGKEMKNIRLEFKKGKIVSASAKENQETLEKIINTDEGARYIGEFGIGCNSGVEKWTGELFLDEVINGTIHLAIGDSYKECGGDNRSAVHFDIVTDVRKRNKVFADGKEVKLLSK